ncbi:hypothetical protein [Pseudomonas sp. MYb118]|uniref:hypothetical protein n=1 Tax=Pseudomonas sp. MYb118 TaxID=1848720 RepID=UPI0034CE2044
MSTEQQLSFIAAIRCDDTTMKFFEQMQAVPEGQGNLLTTNHQYSTTTRKMVRVHKARNVHERTRSDEMVVYFNRHDDHYALQVRSDKFLGKYLIKTSNGLLGATTGAGSDTTLFNLLNNEQQVITLDDLQNTHASVYLQVRNSGVIKRQHMQEPRLYCYGDGSGESVKFNLRILERNVLQPTGNEPYPLFIEPITESDED